MLSHIAQLHRHTPKLTALESRGAALRRVNYYRNVTSAPLVPIVERQTFDTAARLVACYDARLRGPSSRRAFSLTGKVIFDTSVDSGWHAVLFSALGLEQFRIDGKRHYRESAYDALGRLVAVFETNPVHPQRYCTEQLEYGSALQATYNLAGERIRHGNEAVIRDCISQNLNGQTLRQTEYLPVVSDSFNQLRALTSAPYTTNWLYDALDSLIAQRDTNGNLQTFQFDCAGQLTGAAIGVGAAQPVVVMESCDYSAAGQLANQLAGNGLHQHWIHSCVDGRLSNNLVEHAVQGSLQNVHYRYDPAGNVLSSEDRQAATQWFKQQKVGAIGTFSYDTLYRLSTATGRENASAIIGPGLPALVEFGNYDDSRWRRYRQTYAYDDSNNLTCLQHTAGDLALPTRTLCVDEHSNRGLLHLDDVPADFAASFDRNGNLRTLQPGQPLEWDSRNRLARVTLVSRNAAADDHESYAYDADGQRVGKIAIAMSGVSQHRDETRYLPGLELRSKTFQVDANAAPTVQEDLQVINLSALGISVRVLDWQVAPRANSITKQFRYSVLDPLGSHTLELDEQGRLLTQETYYPFGGTAWWAAQNATEASYKHLRYSGKERDVTGLYYYGYRYYLPWLQRWLNPDPAGKVDGLNEYVFVGNNPMSYSDFEGAVRRPVNQSLVNAPPIAGAATGPIPPIATAQSAPRRVGNSRFNIVRAPLASWDSEARSVNDLDDFIRAKTAYAVSAETFELNWQKASRNAAVQAVLRDNFEHTVPNDEPSDDGQQAYSIKSWGAGRVNGEAGGFNNKFKARKWTFMENFRPSHEKAYFANDVARYQYELVAKALGFFGQLPSLIKREGVVNIMTRLKTKDLQSGSPAMFKVFFEETQNGKSTQRILDDFGLVATQVLRRSKGEYVSFLIKVQPRT